MSADLDHASILLGERGADSGSAILERARQPAQSMPKRALRAARPARGQEMVQNRPAQSACEVVPLLGPDRKVEAGGAWIARIGQVRDAHDQRQHARRHIDPEDPAPADGFGRDTTQQADEQPEMGGGQREDG